MLLQSGWNFPEPLERGGIHMGIDLSRLDVAVPEKLLHGAQIRTTLEQMGRKAVPEGVDAHCEACQGGILIKALADRLPSKPLPPATDKERPAGFGAREKMGPRLLKIIRQRRLGHLADGDEPHLVALADDPKLAVLIVFNIDRCRFADSESAGINHFKEGLVPDAQIVGGVDDREEMFDFIIGGHLRKRLLLLRSPDERERVVSADLLKLKEREEGTKGARVLAMLRGDSDRSLTEAMMNASTS